MNNIRFERILGIILLIPPLIGVILFVLNLLDLGGDMYNLSWKWIGNAEYARDSGGGGYTSAVPLYLGLMAIAGAILLKGTDKRQDKIETGL